MITFKFNNQLAEIEKLLALYKKLNEANVPETILVQISEVIPSGFGYPNIKRNALLTLNFAVAQIDQAHANQKSKINCQIELQKENA